MFNWSWGYYSIFDADAMAIKPEWATTRSVLPLGRGPGASAAQPVIASFVTAGLPVVAMVMVPTIATADRHRYDARLSSHRHSQEQHHDL
jgi:hypothetical protein